MSGDPFWIVHTIDWDVRHRAMAVLVTIALNCVLFQVVVDNKMVDKPKD